MGVTSPEGTPPPPETADWQVLFDGTNLDYWKGFGRGDVPTGWRIEQEILHFAPGTEGGDLVTREVYDDFELELEWRLGDCGNSGIFYRADEGHDNIWQTAPEMQVLDDACHPDTRFPSHRAGANYDLHMATPGATGTSARPAVDVSTSTR